MIFTENTGRGGTYQYFKCIFQGRGCDLPHLPAWLVEDTVSALWSTQRLPPPDFITQVRTQMREVLETQLTLLERPDELYRRLNDQGKRQLNQAIFEALYVDLDPMTPT